MKIYIHVSRDPYTGSITRMAIYENLDQARNSAHRYHTKHIHALENGEIIEHTLGDGMVDFDEPVVRYEYDIKVKEKPVVEGVENEK